MVQTLAGFQLIASHPWIFPYRVGIGSALGAFLPWKVLLTSSFPYLRVLQMVCLSFPTFHGFIDCCLLSSKFDHETLKYIGESPASW